jgi:hypothetical protein
VAKFEFLSWLPTKKYEISDREIPDDNAPILTFDQASSTYKTKCRWGKENMNEKKPRRTEVFLKQ